MYHFTPMNSRAYIIFEAGRSSRKSSGFRVGKGREGGGDTSIREELFCEGEERSGEVEVEDGA